MHPITASAECPTVAAGAVSVAPHAEMKGTSWSAFSSASLRIRAPSVSGSAAAA